MSELSESSQPVAPTNIATRTPASGPCKCARNSCWHQRQCKSNGIVKILRAAKAEGEKRTSVVLCRECAAPTRRQRVA
jgi:hypothetical protein